MDTYGASFEGFVPSCGWALYRNAESVIIPHLKAEAERWRKRRDEAAEERTALVGLKTDIDGMAKSYEGLVGRLRAKIAGGRRTVREVMPLGLSETDDAAADKWRDLSAWIDAAKTPIGQMEVFHKYAYERADYDLNVYANCFESTLTDIRFWERTLELQRAYWVFEKAELKYKTKICRELVKMLGEYVGDCRVQLSARSQEEEGEWSAVYEDIEWLLDEAQKDLAYYRQIKSDIAEVGVTEAIKLSSRKVTPPASDAPCGGDSEK